MNPPIEDPPKNIKVDKLEEILDMSSSEFDQFMDNVDNEDKEDNTSVDNNLHFGELFNNVDLSNDANCLQSPGQPEQMLEGHFQPAESLPFPTSDQVQHEQPSSSRTKMKKPSRSKKLRGLPKEEADRRRLRINEMEKKRMHGQRQVLNQLNSLLPDIFKDDDKNLTMSDTLKLATRYTWLLGVFAETGISVDSPAFQIGLQMIKNAKSSKWEKDVIDLQAISHLFQHKKGGMFPTLKENSDLSLRNVLSSCSQKYSNPLWHALHLEAAKASSAPDSRDLESLSVPDGPHLESLPTPDGPHLESLPTPDGTHLESLPTPDGTHLESLPAPDGPHLESLPTPDGTHLASSSVSQPPDSHARGPHAPVVSNHWPNTRPLDPNYGMAYSHGPPTGQAPTHTAPIPQPNMAGYHNLNYGSGVPQTMLPKAHKNYGQSIFKTPSAPFQLAASREIPAWLPAAGNASHVMTSPHLDPIYGGANNQHRTSSDHQAAQLTPHNGMAYSHGQPTFQASTSMGPVPQPMGCYPIATNQPLHGSGLRSLSEPFQHRPSLVPGMSAEFALTSHLPAATETLSAHRRRSRNAALDMYSSSPNYSINGHTIHQQNQAFFQPIHQGPTHQYAPSLNATTASHAISTHLHGQSSLAHPMVREPLSEFGCGVDIDQSALTIHGTSRQFMTHNRAPKSVQNTVWPNQFQHQ